MFYKKFFNLFFFTIGLTIAVNSNANCPDPSTQIQYINGKYFGKNTDFYIKTEQITNEKEWMQINMNMQNNPDPRKLSLSKVEIFDLKETEIFDTYGNPIVFGYVNRGILCSYEYEKKTVLTLASPKGAVYYITPPFHLNNWVKLNKIGENDWECNENCNLEYVGTYSKFN